MNIDIVQAAFLGFIQGMSEFLPISSTAHLILIPHFFSWSDPGLAFNVALHIGTLVAVIAYFWRDWFGILVSALPTHISQRIRKFSSVQEYPSGLLGFLILATIPGAIVGFFLQDLVASALRHPLVCAMTLVVFGYLLYWVDRRMKGEKKMGQATWLDMLWIGIAQTLALVPGVSRSGITMTMGRYLGFTRVESARISFLLSTPIIFGAALSQLPDLVDGGFTFALLLGIGVSALSGYVAIAFLLRWIARVGYGIFFWYRTVLAILIVATYVWLV